MDAKATIFSLDIRNFKKSGEKILDSAILLKDEDLYSYHILVSVGFEILLKSIIAAKICLSSNRTNEDDILNEIIKELKCFGHDLEKIFNEVFKYFPQLKTNLKISQIKKIENEFLYEYRIILKNNECVSIKDFEGVRYQSFANKKNVLLQAPQEHELYFIGKFKEELKKIYDNLYKKLPKPM